MSSAHVDQNEKAYQKQAGVATNKKVHLKAVFAKGTSKKPVRYYKSVGLGFKTPKTAILGSYVDKKCPFTSDVAIRGRILKGVVRTFKMKRTLIVRRDYMHYIPKYNRFEKRHRSLAAHVSPAFRVQEGDTVTIGECRPLAKTVSFNVLKVDSAGKQSGLKGFSAF